jgi:Gamma-glutamyl cyclotransferase, AIG2-like
LSNTADMPTTVPSRRLDRHPASMPGSLFTYGTLLFPEVLQALIGRVPQRQMTSAPGWRVAAVRDRVYPGLVAAPDSIAPGRLVTELTEDEWRLIDDFEGDRYELRQLSLANGRDDGFAYVLIDDAEACPHNWDLENFAKAYLPTYAKHCAAWRARYDRPG